MNGTPYTPDHITQLAPHEIFVFGSNRAGFSAGDIAPLFRAAMELPNVSLPRDFAEILRQN